MNSQTRNEVAIAFSLHPEGKSGVQTHTRLLERGITNAGVACSLVTPFSGGKHWLPVFAARPLLLEYVNQDWSTRWHRHWHFAALRQNLRQELSRRRVGVVIAQCAPSAIAALQVREQLGADFKVALVCHFTVSEAEELLEKGVLRDPVVRARIEADEKYAVEEVDLVVHDSEWQRRSIEVVRGLRPRASTVIWHGIPANVRGGAITRADLGYAPDDVVLVNVGTLEPRKNQIGLIDAFEHIVTRFPRAKLLLIGGDGVHRRAIERRIASGGLERSVKLLVNWPDVPSALESADIYVHFATIESFGLVLLEAARAGLPIAAVPAGGAAEVLARLEGVRLDGNDAEQCWRALQPLLEDAAMRQEMGRRARRNFEQFFTLERMIDGYLHGIGVTPTPSPARADSVRRAPRRRGQSAQLYPGTPRAAQ